MENVSQWDRPEWEALRGKTTAELADLGCQLWDSSKLMLFPAAWFAYIPEGFEVTTINGAAVRFSKDTTSGDRRYGALAFGVIGR